ncbi:MAG TPA: hypothetical protein ENG03_04275 [Thioploca sp.]|nr:hypothetical protein [Thioploca sp.]
MNAAPSNLSYEFYYLLRTDIERDDHTRLSEPDSFATVQSPRITKDGLAIDNDKRLFRADAFTPERQPAALEEWPIYLKSGWEKIQRYYTEQFANQGLNENQAHTFCTQALLGVALLINDASIKSHAVTVPVTGHNAMVFKPDDWLLEVVDTEDSAVDKMPAPAALYRFESQLRSRRQNQHWQLRLDLPIPQLAPLDMMTESANPVFAVYGLAHGDLHNVGAATWPEQLQDFLSGGEPALIVYMLPRLLVRKWQFTRMDLAALTMRKQLRVCSASHNQTQLSCLSNQQLSEGLQTMAGQAADTSLLLGKLHQAIKTLEIHQHNLARWLRRARKHSQRWEVVWQSDDETPLLDSFDADAQKLHNHIAYTEGELTYLDGIRQRWRLHFDGRQLAWSDRISNLGGILSLLVAVGVASITASSTGTLSASGSNSWLSPVVHFLEGLQTHPFIADFIRLFHNPVVYWVVIFILLLPIFGYLSKAMWRKIRCRRLRGR